MPVTLLLAEPVATRPPSTARTTSVGRRSHSAAQAGTGGHGGLVRAASAGLGAAFGALIGVSVEDLIGVSVEDLMTRDLRRSAR